MYMVTYGIAQYRFIAFKKKKKKIHIPRVSELWFHYTEHFPFFNTTNPSSKVLFL